MWRFSDSGVRRSGDGEGLLALLPWELPSGWWSRKPQTSRKGDVLPDDIGVRAPAPNLMRGKKRASVERAREPALWHKLCGKARVAPARDRIT